ncbi:MAG: hypothetical protein JXR59_04060 [Desulfuromonadaceae bacterium]|nr:hypothetical protein [Desulfuromonadaceae bacterium]
MSPELIRTLLEHLAENPTTSFERWMAYRETCLATGRSVFWLMRPRQEEKPITTATLVDGLQLQAHSRTVLMQRIMAARPDQENILAFVGSDAPATARQPE